MVKRYYDRFKSFLKRAAGSISVAFICLTGVFGFNMDAITVHADTYTPVQKQSFFTWLISYFGINIYTDAQQINEDLYTAVKLAYDLYVQTLQPSQQVPFDKLFDGLTWDNATPNTLKVSGWVFNAIKGFASYINSQIYDPTDVDGLNIGTFETVSNASYYPIPYRENTFIGNIFGNQQLYYYLNTNVETRIVFIEWRNASNTLYRDAVAVSLSSFQGNYNRGQIGTSYNYNGKINNIYYYAYDSYSQFDNAVLPFYVLDGTHTRGDNAWNQAVIDLSFGQYASNPETELNDIFALPQQGVLDDLIGATDPEDDVQLDLSQSDINISILQSLSDLIDQVNTLTDSYILDNSWPETIGKVIAESVPITNELTEVDYPNALTWEVPELISTPQIIPLITPECPDLSACLVSGIHDVGQALGNVIESNSNVSNYVSVILFMGIALTILGGI